MPFTAAERMRQYRKRLKKHEEVDEKKKRKNWTKKSYKKISNYQRPA